MLVAKNKADVEQINNALKRDYSDMKITIYYDRCPSSKYNNWNAGGYESADDYEEVYINPKYFSPLLDILYDFIKEDKIIKVPDDKERK